MAKKNNPQVSVGPKPATIIITMVLIIGGLFVLSFMLAGAVGLSMLFGEEEVVTGNVAIIEVKGFISSEGLTGAFETGASASSITKLLRKANDDESVKAVIVEINSGGGAPVASSDIASAVADLDKPVVAWIRDVGASGAYWIASSADHVVAHELSITGSIGVQGSYLEFSGLLDDYNISYERMVAGRYKDTGTPLRELTPTERTLLHNKLDVMHDFFIQAVATNRNLSVTQVEEVADGMYVLGLEALDAKLVDELGGRDQVIAYLEEVLDEEIEATYMRQKSSFSSLFSSVSQDHGFAMGQGLGFSLKQEEFVVRT